MVMMLVAQTTTTVFEFPRLFPGRRCFLPLSSPSSFFLSLSLSFKLFFAGQQTHFCRGVGQKPGSSSQEPLLSYGSGSHACGCGLNTPDMELLFMAHGRGDSKEKLCRVWQPQQESDLATPFPARPAARLSARLAAEAQRPRSGPALCLASMLPRTLHAGARVFFCLPLSFFVPGARNGVKKDADGVRFSAEVVLVLEQGLAVRRPQFPP